MRVAIRSFHGLSGGRHDYVHATGAGSLLIDKLGVAADFTRTATVSNVPGFTLLWGRRIFRSTPGPKRWTSSLMSAVFGHTRAGRRAVRAGNFIRGHGGDRQLNGGDDDRRFWFRAASARDNSIVTIIGIANLDITFGGQHLSSKRRGARFVIPPPDHTGPVTSGGVAGYGPARSVWGGRGAKPMAVPGFRVNKDRAGSETSPSRSGKRPLSIVFPSANLLEIFGYFVHHRQLCRDRRPEHLGQSGPDDHRDRRDGVHGDRPALLDATTPNPAARGIVADERFHLPDERRRQLCVEATGDVALVGVPG